MAHSDTTSRRQLLAAAGSVGIAGLAGCSSDPTGGTNGDDDNNSKNGSDRTDGGTENKPIDPKWTNGVESVPKNLQYNPYNQSTPYHEGVGRVVMSPLNRIDWSGPKKIPYVADEWTKEKSDTYVITLSDIELPFHDGNGKLTAKDVATKFKLDTYLKFPLSNFTKPENITAGDGKVTVKLTKNFNEAILDERFANYRIDTPHHVYKEYLQKFQDATSESGLTEAKKELTSFTLTEPVGSGPFKFASADSQELVLEKWDKHPAADKINFPKWNYIYASSNQDFWQALKGGEIDGGGRFAPKKVIKSFPDYVQRNMSPGFWGMGIGFNYQNKHYKKRDVRKAIAYALNRQKVAKNAGGDSKVGVGRITGIGGTAQGYPKQLLGDYYDKLENYGLKAKPEKAAEHMRKAGYSKESGKWVGPDGDTPKFPMKVIAGYSDWVSAVQTIVPQLSQFGFNAEMVSVEATSFWSQWRSSDFTVMGVGWSAGNPVPYLNFDYELRSEGVVQYAGFPVEKAKVPEFWKPDGDLIDVAIGERLDTLAKTSPDAEDYVQKVAELSWIQNQTMIRMPVQEKFSQNWLTSNDWNIPPANKVRMDGPQTWYIRHGDLTAKTKQ